MFKRKKEINVTQQIIEMDGKVINEYLDYIQELKKENLHYKEIINKVINYIKHEVIKTTTSEIVLDMLEGKIKWIKFIYYYII